MINPEQPWARIKTPPAVPKPCSALALRLLDDSNFATLLAAHLVPGQERKAHHVLWTTVAFNDDLTERAFDVMERWTDLCEAECERKPGGRPQKFLEFVNGAWERLLKIRDLDTTDRGAPSSDPSTLTGRLVVALEAHQEASQIPTPVDTALWAIPVHARGRRTRSDGRSGETPVSKYWSAAPSFTGQLIQGIRDHSRLTSTERQADYELWSVLDELETER